MRYSILPALVVIGASFASSRPFSESEDISVRNLALHSRNFDTDDTIAARHVMDEEGTQLVRRDPIYLQRRAGAPPIAAPSIPNGTPTTPPSLLVARNNWIQNFPPLTT